MFPLFTLSLLITAAVVNPSYFHTLQLDPAYNHFKSIIVASLRTIQTLIITAIIDALEHAREPLMTLPLFLFLCLRC